MGRIRKVLLEDPIPSSLKIRSAVLETVWTIVEYIHQKHETEQQQIYDKQCLISQNMLAQEIKASGLSGGSILDTLRHSNVSCDTKAESS